MLAQSPATHSVSHEFEVASVKPTVPDWQGGAYFTMRGGHEFVVKNYTLKSLVAAAWDLPTRLISGGTAWITVDHYDIVARTPGEIPPSRDEQMLMLQKLLSDRFKLTVHREQKAFPIYSLTVAKSGSRMKKSEGAPPDGRPALVFRLFPERRALLPVHDATMAEFASVLQQGAVDRPVVDKTGLTGRYDFDLDWAPDESDFAGMMRARPPLPEDSAKPGIFAALQQQLGLKLDATRGLIDTIVIDHLEKPPEF